MSRQHALKEVEIDERFAPDLPLVEMDGSQMEQVFTNILQNAGEAMEGKGRITIETGYGRHTQSGWRQDAGVTGRNEDAVFIRFQDTGPGISSSHIEHIFDLFFTTKQSGHGTGVGLAVCQRIVERHGGWITVDSRPGEGSVFTVFLPVRQRKGENPSPEEGKSR
jgi:signal transduction histidine kinase